MGKNRLFPRTILLVLLNLLPICILAQASMDELLTGYELASIKGESTMPYATKISQLFRGSPQKQQEALLTNIYNRVVGDTITEKNSVAGKFGLIDLYAMLAESNDKRLDDLSFKKGEICALQTGDTVMLKECITALNLSDHSKTTQVTEYISTLQDYLEEIRNFIPASRRIDGVWVSDLYCLTLSHDFMSPYLILVSSNGEIRLESVGYGRHLSNANLSSKVFNQQNLLPQSIIDLGDEKVYMAWSNEKINIPNQQVGIALSQTTGSTLGQLAREGMSSVIGGFGGDFIGNLTGNLASTMVMSMFTPTKVIHVLEMELQRINEYELVARTHRKEIQQAGGNTPTVKEYYDNILFTRYDNNFGAYIVGIPSPQNLENLEQAKNVYIENGITEKELLKPNNISIFNRIQHHKLAYNNKQKMLQLGCGMSVTHSQREYVPCLGITTIGLREDLIEQLDEKLRKQYKRFSTKTDCLYVTYVDEKSPAKLWGIKKGDIICEVDGFTIGTPEQFVNYIRSLHPFDWVNLRLKRNNKIFNLSVELDYIYDN